jgi:hypothetical protein
MTDEQHQIIRNAVKLQRQGRVGDSIRLRILAAELKTMRFGPEIRHDATR